MGQSPERNSEPPVTPLRLPRRVDTVVVYGGMFDPPHEFHTSAVPGLVSESLGARAFVLFVPAAKSPLKPRGPVASDTERVTMLRRAVGRGRVWTDECDRARWLRARGRETASYTIDTLRRLRSILPRDVKLRLLIGTDQAVDFHRWKGSRSIIRLAEPLVMVRGALSTPGALTRAMDKKFWATTERAAWGKRLLTNAAIEVSSTEVRASIGVKPDAADWPHVPARVANYIAAHGLYGARRQGTRRSSALRPRAD